MTAGKTDFARLAERLGGLDDVQIRWLRVAVREMSIETMRGQGPTKDRHGRDADRFVRAWFGRSGAPRFPQEIEDLVSARAYDGQLGQVLLALGQPARLT